jgi:hypothetical protein
VLALAVAGPPVAEPQASPASPEPARVSKSVRGTLVRVDLRRRAVIMKSDEGKNLEWRFSQAVVEEARKFEPGSPLIVIYRQTSPSDKRVTALAFPGAAPRPVYVNMTGSPVLMRSAPGVGDVCGQAEPGSVNDSVLPVLGRAEVKDACFCCAPQGETCSPGNRTGNGVAFLESCFASER